MTRRCKWRPRRTLINDDQCPFLLSIPLLSYLSIFSCLHFSDQQGIGSGRFPGSQRSVSPGTVALSALHCVWNHDVHLCHRCIDFLPVWKTTVKATLAQGYAHTQKKTSHMPWISTHPNISPLNVKQAQSLFRQPSPQSCFIYSTPGWKRKKGQKNAKCKPNGRTGV